MQESGFPNICYYVKLLQIGSHMYVTHLEFALHCMVLVHIKPINSMIHTH